MMRQLMMSGCPCLCHRSRNGMNHRESCCDAPEYAEKRLDEKRPVDVYEKRR